MKTVYRALHPISWAGHGRAHVGDLVIDPPAFVENKLGDKLERLDEDGKIPRGILRKLHYNRLQQLAAAGDVDDVNGNSPMEDVIDAYALDDVETQAAKEIESE